MKHRTYDEVKNAIRYIGLVGRGQESNVNQDILLDLLEERDALHAAFNNLLPDFEALSVAVALQRKLNQ